MLSKSAIRRREFLYQVHLWTGLIGALLLIPICLTGSYLVFHVAIDSTLNPERHVPSDARVELPPEEYIRIVDEAIPETDPGALFIPAPAGAPVIVATTYPERPAKGEQQHRVFAWVDPASGRILDTNDSKTTFIAWAHRFHFYLAADGTRGRQLVGLSGILLLLSAVTAIWMWWPKPRDLWRSVSWQSRQKTSRNLHFVFGIWIAIPMVILATTGIYLSFPDASARAVGLFTEIEEPIPLAEPIPARPQSDLHSRPADVIEAARGAVGDAAFMALDFPALEQRNWTVTFRGAGGPPTSVLVEDASLRVSRPEAPTPPKAGDRFTHLMHILHDGTELGLAYRWILFVAGLLPGLLLVTGVILWLRRRSLRARAAANRARA
ncbi:MAG: PepSY domain-containing protein [Proteobacteria bacterium]|nr:PepSY domain-containing protein [Pseudomonadota bacterium]